MRSGGIGIRSTSFWIPPWSTTVFLGELTRPSWVRSLATAGVCHRCFGCTSGPRLPPRGTLCSPHFLDSPLEHHRVPRRIYAPLVGARSGYRRGVPPVHEWYFWPFWILPWSTTVFLGEFTRLSWVRALATAGVCHRCMGGTSGPRLPPGGFRCYSRRCALRFSPERAPPKIATQVRGSWPF